MCATTERSASRGRVLVVDDSDTIQSIVGQSLRDRGYTSVSATSGAEALEIIRDEAPDVVILDLNLPDIGGFEVCKRIKTDPYTHRIPVMVLTGLEQPGFEVMAIDAGADDFVSKPPDPLVLDARLSMLIQRSRRERMSNPLTGLPGNVPIDQELACRLAQGRLFCYAYADLDHFKHYNSRYGYQSGDEVILLTARIIQSTVRHLGNPDDFVGHLGGDDFVFMTTPDRVDAIAETIIKEFDEAVADHYDEGVRRDGWFELVDRRGQTLKVPIMSISLAMASNEHREFWAPIEMADVVTELKQYARSQPGSTFVKERRRSDQGVRSPE